MNEDHHDSAEELIPKYLAGEASPDEERRMFDWIGQGKENARHFEDAKKIFELGSRHYQRRSVSSLDIDLDNEWAQLTSRIQPSKRVVSLPPANTISRGWWRLAAVLALFIVSGAVITYVITKNADVNVQTAEETLAVSLPDGSRVVLNRHSRLSYSKTFGASNRSVSLTGEAFFDVVHDSRNPFTVRVGRTMVEVVGTSFDIQGYDGEQQVEVTVQTGVVKFSQPATQKQTLLTAGQRGIYSKGDGSIVAATNHDVNFLAWNSRKIIFNGNDLGSVVATLNKVYQSNIVIASEIPASCVVTVTFDHQTLEAVLHVLETTLNLSFRVSGDRIEIVRAGC